MITTAPRRTATEFRTETVASGAEVALVAVTAVTCVGFIRVFETWGFLPRLLVAAVGSHLVSAGVRRAKRGLAVTLAASLIIGVVVLANVLYSVTTSFLLPTGRTIDALFDDLRLASQTFPTAVPPVDGTGGYLAAATIAVWFAAFLADGFAFRAKATAEAIVPVGILFVFVSAVAADRHRSLHAMAFLGAALAFSAVHRAYRRIDAGGWLSGHKRGAATALVRVGGMLAIVATVSAFLIGPQLPGAGSDPIIDAKRAGPDTLYVISPLVDIKKRVSSRSNTELFTVRASTRTYLRATALPDFNGRQWTSDLRQQDARDVLGTARVNGERINAEITVAALADVWMPTPFQTTGLIASTMKNEPKWDQDTSTLLVPGSLRKGDKYVVTAVVPQFDVPTARRLSQSQVRSIPSKYLVLPGDYPTGLVDLARDITKDGATKFDKAKLLQDWFRQSFTYDLSVKAGQATDDIEGFIESRRGYCEQFSGSFAAMARSLGIPARVAVGFTPGEETAPGVFTIRAKHAHAWPEIYIERLGWIAFEPTPGRGNAATTFYTGVQGEQVDEPAGSLTADPNASSTSSTSMSLSGLDADSVPLFPEGTQTDGSSAIFEDTGGDRLLWWLGSLGSAAAIGAIYPLALRRVVNRRWSKRREHAATGRDKVLVAWNRTRFNLANAGIEPRPSETPLEFADRVGRSAPVNGHSLEHLAELVTAGVFGGVEPAGNELATAEQVPYRVASDLFAVADRRDRLRKRLDPRPAFSRLPGDEHADRFDVREN